MEPNECLKEEIQNNMDMAKVEKKDPLWMGGISSCFASVVSLLLGHNKEDKTNAEDWVVPYELLTDLNFIGSGAQGVVFSGKFRGEIVAVKKLRDKTETDLEHLLKLDHANIVKFKGVCTKPPCYCVIMEYCPCGSLFDFLRRPISIKARQIFKWAQDIAHGMEYLHSNKIIHRDLKSLNVLVADNLVAKVSDFGTSRKWNNKSVVMSFTGTVAWMAPEVVRQEPCSERVDVWSYGVVLWELLTLEVPYKNVDEHAIMWGVGNESISLPIPSDCPDSLRHLMQQCWNRVSRNRPPFKIICAHLDIAEEEICAIENFDTRQAKWKSEVQESMVKIYESSGTIVQKDDMATWQRRREDVRQLRDMRQRYEKQLAKANDLYMDVCAVRLELEQREKSLYEREKILLKCRCGIDHKLRVKNYIRQTSSSSENIKSLSKLTKKIKKNMATTLI